MASAKTAAVAVADTPEIDAAPVVEKKGMAYEMDDGLGLKARIGLIVLASDQTIEHEFRQIITMPDVALYESRLYCALEVNIETLKAMEGDIAPATELLVPGSALDVVAFGCTSGGMVIGDETVFERIREARPDVACTTPMTSAFAALGALGARRVCLITPYHRRRRRYHARLRAGERLRGAGGRLVERVGRPQGCPHFTRYHQARRA